MEPIRAEARRGLLRTLGGFGTLLALTLLLQVPRGLGVNVSGSQTYDASWTVWPQGWNLFADNEYAPELVAYVHGPAGWRSGQLGPQVQARNAWGLKRAQRLQSQEIAALNDLIPPASWHPCGARAIEDCATTSPVLTIVDPAADPTLCGLVALSGQTLDRWGTRAAADHWRIDRAVVLDVRCR